MEEDGSNDGLTTGRTSRLGPQTSGFTSRLDPRALVIGAVVDNLLTFAAAAGLPRVAAVEPAADPDRFLLILEVAGLLSTAVGGYVAARIARVAPLRHGAAVAVIALAVALLSRFGASTEVPAWYSTSAYLLLVPAGAAGAVLARFVSARRVEREKRTC